MNNPLVSICCVTYNHENYIRQCLDGFVMQQTTFEYEILVHEDASTDSTAKILKEYESKYPHLFRCVYQTVNQFKIQNTLTNILFTMARGKYIALCEGDDYWTDPLKLQKQVDFLEANPDYNICFHKVQIFNQEENKFNIDTITREVSETTKIEDLARGNFMHTPSVLMRNNFTIPKWFSKSPIGDWTLYMIVLKDKKIKKLDDVMAVYRVHKASVWASKSAEYRILNTIKSIELVINAKVVKPEVEFTLITQVENFKRQLPRKMNILDRLLSKSKRMFNG